MDIVSLSTAMSTQQLMDDVQVAVLSESLDTLQDAGDSMIKTMEASVTPHLGQSIDCSI